MNKYYTTLSTQKKSIILSFYILVVNYYCHAYLKIRKRSELEGNPSSIKVYDGIEVYNIWYYVRKILN